MQLVNSVVFSLLVFYTVKLQGTFFVFWLAYFITSCVGVSAFCRLSAAPTTCRSVYIAVRSSPDPALASNPDPADQTLAHDQTLNRILTSIRTVTLM